MGRISPHTQLLTFSGCCKAAFRNTRGQRRSFSSAVKLLGHFIKYVIRIATCIGARRFVPWCDLLLRSLMWLCSLAKGGREKAAPRRSKEPLRPLSGLQDKNGTCEDPIPLHYRSRSLFTNTRPSPKARWQPSAKRFQVDLPRIRRL